VDLQPQTAALKAVLDALPGVTTVIGMTNGRRPEPQAIRYRVMDKMFAILAVRGAPWMTIKCDPHMIEILEEQYSGVGHRTHLDHRHWISVDLGSDVPAEEAQRLAESAYRLVRSGLTRKQQTELAAADGGA
jgi:predicted DNA-binding protein (MmcQ/YjbR family)